MKEKEFEFYSLGARDEMAMIAMLIRAGGIKFALKNICEKYEKIDNNIHITWLKENIENIK